MGLLDDLKNKSDSLKNEKEKEKQRVAALEKYYQENIHPKMSEIYTYLDKFLEHLNYLKSDTIAHYPILPKGQPKPFKQKNYKINIDSSKCIKNINFFFTCHLDDVIKFDMEGSEVILRYSDVLDSYKMEYLRNDYKNKEYELISSTFKLKGPIKVNFVFQGNVEDSSIEMLIGNFEKPGVVKHTFKDHHITEEFLDGLGKYILRENKTFFSLNIDEENKEKIRQKIQEDIKRRKEELEEAERLLKEEEEKEKEKKSWKNLFKKTD